MKDVVIVEESMRSFRSTLSVILWLGAWSLGAEGESVHWNQLRGPNGAGIAAGFRPPLKIAADQAAWETSPTLRPEMLLRSTQVM